MYYVEWQPKSYNTKIGDSAHEQEAGKGAVDAWAYWRRSMQRHKTENSKQIFPETELRGLSPNFHINMSVSGFIFPQSVCLF